MRIIKGPQTLKMRGQTVPDRGICVVSTKGIFPHRTIEGQGLARPMPGQEPLLAVFRHLLHAIELLREPLCLPPSSLALTDGPKLLLPTLQPEHTPDVATSGLLLPVFAVPKHSTSE
jgi:hypothetical protein